MALAFAAIWNINAQSAQSAQERFEAFRRRANADYERFRTEALNSYADFLEQAWQDYEVVAGHRRDETPKPITQPTISDEEKAALQTDGQIIKTLEAIPDTTNAWFSTLQWNGSRLEQIVDKGMDQLRTVSVKMSTTVVTLSDIARERRKAIAKRLKKLGSISEDYVAPSELRRLKKEAAANQLLADNASKSTSKQLEQPASQTSQKEKQENTPTQPAKEISTQPMAAQAAAPVVAPQSPMAPVMEDDPTIDFNLYGLDISISVPNIAPKAITTTGMQQQIAAYWKKINNANLNNVIDELTELSLLYNLGDWCTFKAVEQYSTIWAGEFENAKNLMIQYLLLNMGYDVRLAMSKNEVLLLLPFDQQVYGRSYVPIENKKYFIYPHGRDSLALLSTCTLPQELVCESFNLIKNEPIVLPRENKLFTVEYGDMSVSGNINLNVIRMQQEYPKMDTPCYASSMHDTVVRLSIVEQLKKQLNDLPEQAAADSLLHFVEHGFKYKTDREQFGEGVEKPFFFEEILYHPYCDCEDRAIFYSYLVKQVLGLDVVLVHFPGHSCTAVAFNQPPTRYNVSYVHKGKRYYICDPTYITADIGMCMPDYRSVNPIFQEWYNIEEVKM